MINVDERLTAILALQRRLDEWRRGWHRQHKAQEAKAKKRRYGDVCRRRM